MAGLTIDQILAEARGEKPELYVLDKSASVKQPPKSSQFSNEEIVKMASFLKEAQIPEGRKESFNEKLASALILSDSINALMKQAEAACSKGHEEPKKKTEEGEDKVAHFIKSAKAKGFSDEEIKALLEKKAGKAQATTGFLSKALKSKALKGALGLGAVGTAGAVGHEVGESQTKEKAKKVIPLFYRKGLMEGYRAGAMRGFQAGAQAKKQG